MYVCMYMSMCIYVHMYTAESGFKESVDLIQKKNVYVKIHVYEYVHEMCICMHCMSKCMTVCEMQYALHEYVHFTY